MLVLTFADDREGRRRHPLLGRIGVLAAFAAMILLGGLSAREAIAAENATRGVEGYGYELASPPSTAGQDPMPVDVSAIGDDILFLSSGGFADVPNLNVAGHLYRATRTAISWMTESAGLPPVAAFPGGGVVSDWQANWWELERPRLMASVEPAYDPEGSDNETRLMVGTKGGDWLRVTPANSGASLLTWATSRDLSGVLFVSPDRWTLTDGTTDTRNAGKQGLYASSTDADGELDVHQVAKQGGVTMYPTCDIHLGTPGTAIKRPAVDRDGLKRVIWTTAGTGCTTAARQRVYVSEPFSDTPDSFEISVSQCTVSCGTAQTVRFVGGSVDTDRIYMSTNQKLVNEDPNTTMDIYEYDFRRVGDARLRMATGGAGSTTVLGVVAVSDDGTHLYYVDRGVLEDAEQLGDEEPVLGSPNLYVRVSPTAGGPAETRFIATLSEADSGLWFTGNRPAVPTPDGRYLFITTATPLTEDKKPGDSLSDVYRIDAETGEILRGWVTASGHNGAARTYQAQGPFANHAFGQLANTQSSTRSKIVADGGSAVLLQTAKPLVAGDDNGALDVLLWRPDEGTIAMISDGHDLEGVSTGNIPLRTP